ncbi:hypothetical protein FOZ61_010745 [Perkinsus olseni]|uniref:Uncharacterized protein n=1 Tax=Perkinsus olseni TaxID=32597 RepID=A0A7J6KX58_PEROL|nr:hypothetical protein FOZ61_010745 [Perkinsus olseni]
MDVIDTLHNVVLKPLAIVFMAKVCIRSLVTACHYHHSPEDTSHMQQQILHALGLGYILVVLILDSRRSDGVTSFFNCTAVSRTHSPCRHGCSLYGFQVCLA